MWVNCLDVFIQQLSLIGGENMFVCQKDINAGIVPEDDDYTCAECSNCKE